MISGKIFTFCVVDAVLFVQNVNVKGVLQSSDHKEFKTHINISF